MKRILALILALAIVFPLTACTGDGTESGDIAVDEEQSSAVTASPVTVVYDSDDEDADWDSSQVSSITLAGDSIALSGGGAIVDGSQVTIISIGTYLISGILNDGQIVVNTDEIGPVRLVLNGANITCSTSAPIYVVNADKVVITLANGSENYVTDGDAYIFEDEESDEPNAAVFSKDDLTINGDGSLAVDANYNNGIQSKDELKIIGANITVDAVNDGIKGRDCIAVRGGNITVNAGGDGMQSNNDEDSDKGWVVIEGGNIDINAGEDGIQAETSLVINSGNIAISSGGGSANSSSNIGLDGNTWGEWGGMRPGDVSASTSTPGSAKGLKAGLDLTISGATISIDSSDDALHSNGSLTINSGDITLASGDDGIHSDATLEINGGDIRITKCYEGLESAVITINDGNIHLVASDDGINVVGGNDGSSVNGRPGQNNFESFGDKYLYINGGYVVIDATGDGCDINGSIEIAGGVVIINGPTSNMNGALDYYGTCIVSGGFLVAAGSSGMAQAPSTSSTQYSVMLNFSSAQPAESIVHIETEDGEEILTFVPTKAYQSLVLSSPELKNGETYIVYTGGSSTGTAIDGLYSRGTYTAGTQTDSFTISSVVTIAGSPSGSFPGGGGDNMVPRGKQH
jgi:hypothetical protein